MASRPRAYAQWLLCLLMAAQPQLSQSAKTTLVKASREQQIRAALVYKIARFVSWPESVLPATGDFVLCFHTSDGMQDALSGIEDRRIQGRNAQLRAVQRLDSQSIGGCHILYLPDTVGDVPQPVRLQVRAGSVLVISDNPGAAHRGGMIVLIEERNRIRLEVNLTEVRAAGLRISAPLLQLATVIE
jgi:hypothetical protein